MNQNCDLTIGPCACGAWHSKQDVDNLIKELRKIHDSGNSRSGKTEDSRKAYEILVKNKIPLN